MLQARLQETTWRTEIEELVQAAVATEPLAAPNFNRVLSRIENKAIGMLIVHCIKALAKGHAQGAVIFKI